MADTKKIKKALRNFWYGKPHGERRLGDILEPEITTTLSESSSKAFLDMLRKGAVQS